MFLGHRKISPVDQKKIGDQKKSGPRFRGPPAEAGCFAGLGDNEIGDHLDILRLRPEQQRDHKID